jgi:chromate transporter
MTNIPTKPTFRAALRFWLKLGFISFGGPSGQIAIMHTELVERKRWIDESRFLHALNYCMLLPGPEATQLATYCGWLLHGTRGGIAAGALFVLPAIVLLWALSWVYAACGELPAVAAVFHGLKPAVTALVFAALIRIGRRALKGPWHWAIAAAAFAALFFAHVPFPVVISVAAVIGWLARPRDRGEAVAPAGPPAPPLRRMSPVKVLLVSLALWWTPVLVLALWLGGSSTLTQEGVFFSKAAMVTFGGAYAVLPYVGQQAVTHFGWIAAPQMLDGLGLAETTPGPLIMVVQFVGFLGAWQHPGPLPPLLAGTLGAAITTWTTFVPCFLWIFLGAPHIERLHGNRTIDAAMSVVTAAVVGVILNLAVWFALHTFRPPGEGIDAFAIFVAVVALAALLRTRTSVLGVIAVSAALGVLWSYV